MNNNFTDVFKDSATSTHTWSQTVVPLVNRASITFCSKSNQVCIRRFCRSSMSQIFVLHTHCCITLHILLWPPY